MKKLLLLTVFPFFVQGQQFYFSNRPFTAGQESENSLKTDFSTDETIYGLAVLSEEYPSSYPDEERYYSGNNTKVSVFGKSSTIDKSRVEILDGKTYVFYDILPDAENASSPDCMEWYYAYKGKGTMKIEITEISAGDGREFSTLPVKNVVIKIKHASSDMNALYDRLHPIYEKSAENVATLGKEKADLARKKLDEQRKKDGVLPTEYRGQPTFELVDFSVEDAKDYLIQHGRVQNKENIQKIIFSQDWEYFYYEGTCGIRNAEFIAVVKTSDGSCAYWRIQIRAQCKSLPNQFYWPEPNPVKGDYLTYYNCENQ